MKGSVAVLLSFCVLVGFLQGRIFRGRSVSKRSEVCYNRVGCFNTGAPFFSLSRPFNLLPETPDEIRTKFVWFSRQNMKDGHVLDARRPNDFETSWPNFDGEKPLKFVVHGYIDNIHVNQWQNSTKDALLIYGDYNVVLVDWSNGNFFPYTQATGNTRLVGAQIADLILTLKTKANVTGDQIHIIGHSLGAHVAGYAGERIPGLSRITGLDPAGPYFDGTDPTVRLDETDANFVDVMHTDTETLLLIGMGSRMSLGHVDFWPNLGHDQPGCEKSPIQHLLDNGILAGSEEVLACSHLRSLKLFIESVNSPCPFMAYPCDSEINFKAGNCYKCGYPGCSRLGFHADKVKPREKTNFYLNTPGVKPYCTYHVHLTVHMSLSLDKERGFLEANIVGAKTSTGWIRLNENPQYFEGGKEYSFFLPTTKLDHIDKVKITWTHDANKLIPTEWNILGLRHPKIYIDRVIVRLEEAGVETRFCGLNADIETGNEETLRTKC